MAKKALSAPEIPLCINVLRLLNYRLAPDELILFDWLTVKQISFKYKPFHYSQARVEEETRIRRTRQEVIIKQFSALGFLKTDIKVNSVTRGRVRYYSVDFSVLADVDALAYNLWGCEDQVCPLMDARRQQAYTGLYTFSDGQMQTLLPQCAVGIDEITAKINESGKKTVFLGDGVPVFADYLKENLQVPYLFAPAHCNKQRAACVAVLGGILYRQGKAEDAAAHKPDYLRLSQAERERQEKARDFRI